MLVTLSQVVQAACDAAPSGKDLIKELKKEIAFLEKKKNFSQLNADQILRLSTQKDIVANLKPSIDCSALN